MRDDIFKLLHHLLSNGSDCLFFRRLRVFQARHLSVQGFPDRIFNLGILEPSMISFAALSIKVELHHSLFYYSFYYGKSFRAD